MLTAKRRPEANTLRLKLERQKRQRGAMGLMGPWAINQVHVEAALAQSVWSPSGTLTREFASWGVKRLGSLSVLAGALLVAVVVMTSCTDSTVRTGEDSPGQTPGPDATVTDTLSSHVPWTRSDLTVETGGYHPIDISMNKEETLEYQFEVTNSGFENPLNPSSTLDIGFLVTDPSGDVVRSIRAHTSGDSITAGSSGNYALVFDNTYALYFHKSIYFDYRVLPKGVKSATPHTPPPPVLPLSPDGVESHRDGTGIVVSWNAAPGAAYYRIYYSDYPNPSCELHVSRVFDCERLASKVLETTYTHTGPDEYDNYYWVLACSRIGCSDIDSENPVAPAYAGPSALPDNVEYRRDGSAIVVSWNAVPDADYYKVYHDDRSSCSLPSSTLDALGNFSDFSAMSVLSSRPSCEELATDLVETTYTHISPDDYSNTYWVEACNSGGCTNIDSDNPAMLVDTRPSAPNNVEYRRDGTAVVVSWDAAPGADYYNIFYDDTFGTSCRLHRGIPVGCDELATNVVGATYTHTSPVGGDNYYWVAACNSNGCTDTESEDPATFVDTRPSAPNSVQYRRDGTAIVVSWRGVPDADYYKIYYTDSAVSICKSIGDTLVVCEELAINVVGTTYTHTSPDDDYNHYWVVACNSGGCTNLDSENPATFVDTRPSAPNNVQYRRDGTAIVVSWSAAPDADYYNIYYDEFRGSSCRLNSSGRPVRCEELAANVVGTAYTHTSPDADENYYWVVACNRNGCTDVDSENPATFVDTRPSAPPANVEYRRDGTAIVVSWSAAPGADYYKIYYTDSAGPICKSIGGRLFGCEELATDVVGTTYTHTSPDDDYNHYWVVACNSGGCMA